VRKGIVASLDGLNVVLHKKPQELAPEVFTKQNINLLDYKLLNCILGFHKIDSFLKRGYIYC